MTKTFNNVCLLDELMELQSLMTSKVKQCSQGFACLLCAKTIKRKDNMRAHMRSQHMKPREYKCPPCNKILINRNIVLHISKNHPDWQGIDYESFRIE